MVCVINIIPIDKGWFIKANEKAPVIRIKIKKFCIISKQKIVYLKY